MKLGMAAAVAATVSAFSALATVPTETDPISRALQESRPEGGVCTLESATSSAVPPRRQPASADFGCAIGVQKAAALSQDPNAIVIDTRRQVEHDAFRIDGALRIELGAIKTKQHLRERALVMLGSGRGDGDLYAECGNLKKAGFKRVHVLRGGMKEWIAGGQPVIGLAPAPIELAMLAPGELFKEAGFDKNVVLVDAAADRKRMRLERGQTVQKASSAAFQTAAAAAVKKRQGAPFASVVIVVGDAFDRQQLSAVVDSLKPYPALIYAGGAENYGRFLDDQKAMWVAQARGPKTPGCRP